VVLKQKNNPVHSAVFLNKIGSGMHSDPKFGQRGGCASYQRGGCATYVNARKQKVSECHSDLSPSEKELPERHSSTFHYKNTLPV
jgi:hypothetical protein